MQETILITKFVFHLPKCHKVFVMLLYLLIDTLFVFPSIMGFAGLSECHYFCAQHLTSGKASSLYLQTSQVKQSFWKLSVLIFIAGCSYLLQNQLRSQQSFASETEKLDRLLQDAKGKQWSTHIFGRLTYMNMNMCTANVSFPSLK